MTSIRGCERLCRECTSKDLSEFSSLLESSHDEISVDPFAEPLVAKYTKEDLQKILRTVHKTRAPPFDGPREKPLKAKSPNVYCGKSYMECYNFC